MQPADGSALDAPLDSIQPDAPPDPMPTPDPAPVDPEADFYKDRAAQRIGARRALLASSMAGAVETQPERQSKVVALADKLGVTPDVVDKSYDQLSRIVQLKDVDYSRLLDHHPEVASWLAIPANASIAHADLPVLQTLDDALKGLSGRPRDPTGVLPDGYMFKKDGTIRGPLNVDGTAPIIYKGIDAVRAKLEREDSQQRLDQFDASARAAAGEARLKDRWLPSAQAGIEGSLAETFAALQRLTGDRLGLYGLDGQKITGDEFAAGAAGLQAGAAQLNPGALGEIGRVAGQLVGDAPLYLLGGQIAGIADVATAMKTIGMGAKVASLAPRSEYLLDVFKTAAAYSPVGIRSGINTGAEQGPAYGVVDALINTLGPAAFGSRFGLAHAIVPGAETEAARAGWGGVAGRLLMHTGSQGGVMAATELANALHEYATGVDPDALKQESLVPRLAKAGAMGAVLSGAFHLPGAIGDLTMRQQVQAHAAIDHADRMGQVVELIQASQTAGYSPARTAQLLQSLVPEAARTTHFQDEDWVGVAKDMGLKPEDLASEMHVEEQWRLAKATGQSMAVPTAGVLQRLAEKANAGAEPKGIASALRAMRKTPDSANANEALTFFKEKPEEIEARVKAMREDVTETAKSVSTTDPIYADFASRVENAGRPAQEVDADARIVAAYFHTIAHRFTANGTPMDAHAEYEKWKLTVERENPGAALTGPLDAALDRIRKGEIPSEKQVRGESLIPWLRRNKGLKDVGGDLASMGVDVDLKPGESKLINDEGKGLDIAAIRAHDEGYLPDSDPNTLLAAIDKEMRGTPVHNGEEDAVLGPIREGLTGLAEHLKSKGIDIAKGNAEIKAALAGLPEGERYEQGIEPASAHLTFPNLLKQWKKANGDRSPTPGSKDWDHLVKQARMVDEANGKRYEQPGDKSPRGYFDPKTFAITLTGKANLSTVAHEVGHAFLDITSHYAAREDAPQQLKDDWQKIMDYLGVKSREAIGVKEHEVWARSIEQFLKEGHAPSDDLRPVFQRFAMWLGHLYRQVKALVTLTPEVRGVMERLFATDEAIDAVHADLGTSTLFAKGRPEGMSEEGWNAYLGHIRDEREAMHARVFNAAMRTLRSENTKTYRRELAGVTKEAADIVNARPSSIAEDIFVHGLDAEGKDLAEKPKLDRAEIERDYGKGTIHKLPRGITAKGGMSLQMAADLIRTRDPHGIGFRNGEELWTALVNLPNRKADIKTLAEGMMQARHPDLSPDAMLDTAMKAVHANSAHADILNREAAYLAIKAGQKALSREHIKAIAEQLVAETNHRDINPEVHLRAERKASQRSTDAFLKAEPDYTQAFLHKEREELSHALYRAATEAKAMIGKAEELFADARRTKTRAMLGKAGEQAWMVTDANGLVTPFLDGEAATAFAATSPGAIVSKGPGFLSAMDQRRELWQDKPWRYDRTVGEVSDLYDEARSIMHQARNAFTLLVDGKREQLDKEVAAAIHTENEVKKAPIIIPRSLGKLDKVKRFAAWAESLQRRASFVTRQMDGGVTGGKHWELFTRPLNRMGDDEQARRVKNVEAMTAIRKAWGKDHTDRKQFIPAINDHLSLEGRIMVGLNTGTAKNLERLMTGEGWTREQVKAVTDTLDRKDWEFIHAIRQHIGSFWPEIEATKRRLDGIPPKKEAAIPWDTAFGTVEGGYFPIVYDPHLGVKELELSLEKQRQSLFGKPGSGFTEKRAESTGMRLLFDFRAISSHLAGTEHYLSHAEGIAELNKLLNNKALTQNMVERFGKDAFEVIRDTVQDVARGSGGPQNAVEKVLRFLRIRSGLATMGFNMMSGASQVFGMTQSMERVGVGAYLHAQLRVTQSAMSAESMTAFAREKSAMMHDRFNTGNQETMDMQSQGVLGKGMGAVRGHAYWLMHRSQWLVDLPTWLAGYDNALKEFPADDAKCVAIADQHVIDTQGTGMMKDQAKIQRANELGKILTQYGSFFMSTYNMGRSAITSTAAGTQSPLRLAGSFALLVSLPAVAMSVFREAVKPSPENDNSPAFWAKHLAADHLGYLLSTIVLGREFAGAMNGIDYGGPAGMRGFSLAAGLVKQLSQIDLQGHGFDHGLARAALLTGGALFGYPAVQLQRIIDGVIYDSEHGTANPLPLLFGPSRNKR